MRVTGRAALGAVVGLVVCTSSGAQSSAWLQWGGPNRNFHVDGKGLAASWPEQGPRQLWSRPLGEGHSAILVEGNRLYTMYSRGEKEVVIALDAATGKTVWEYMYDAPTTGMDYEYGKGPHATPLIVGNLLFTTGATAKLHALDKRDGKVVWSLDLWKDLNGEVADRGYSCSPIAYKDTIILTLGGPGQTVAAFAQKDGRAVWKKHSLKKSPASHLLIRVGGQEQLVAFLGNEVVGLEPDNGELLWSHPHATDWGLNISTPLWGEDGLLFISSAYNGGSRVLRLTRENGKTSVKEVWFDRGLRVHHSNTLRLGDTVYGSSGDFSVTVLTAVSVQTGSVVWRERRFPKASMVYAGGRVILLDEDGNLGLVELSTQGLKVISQAAVLATKSWTPPTLVGTKLYARDRKSIVALDLGEVREGN
jgi:outer membrane protein assembly factor BamB